ncbi:MAG: anti-sigma regulatory factor [Armatimonadetes bacterium]|nr:anti-sigma regulatory factor [Armatimonadota bacterium]PIU62031.1 MAG: hypothetical protein COS85_19735 [Armatimonadetes bacterium CG07_land_8_20_14_0_80_59_28]PIX44555.1 MAG: hypothetical protein COZ56_04305 [Armatimonadetes bacterium CG_4_8_14_3_um_filter_58_9]PIY48812.1 MAG: hypothetical protein COZ05_02100 [Armatimonadetes bacterium CG_4_10_14_3_um_filter_59_10]PJB63300.1 MAG: hypothetical protein CO095_16745 [Armatimonadetes bacterium CG_4_9_14_3_um_filter_58_7]
MDSRIEISIAIRDNPDVVMARTEARYFAEEIGFEPVDQSRIAAAVSELAANVVRFADGGEMWGARIDRDATKGIEFTFRDRGPGIENVDEVLNDGSAGNGHSRFGMSTARVLVDEFEVDTEIGRGTTVVIRKWVRH